MKAIMIIDLPLNYQYADLVGNIAVYSKDNKVEPKLFNDVPIKPIPNYRGGTHSCWSEGWNACLEQIEGKIDFE